MLLRTFSVVNGDLDVYDTFARHNTVAHIEGGSSVTAIHDPIHEFWDGVLITWILGMTEGGILGWMPVRIFYTQHETERRFLREIGP